MTAAPFTHVEAAKQFVALRPQGGFRVILADPPWEFKNYSEKGEAKNAKKHYQCMSIEDLCALPVHLLAAKNCALFLWCTWPLMPQWNPLITALDFSYEALAWEWIKYNPKTGKYAFGPGYGTRKNLEPCLLASRGNPSLRKAAPGDMFGAHEIPEGVHSVRDFIEWMPGDCVRMPRRQHSRKPDDQYKRIETLFDGPYIELFSRGARKGWQAWGNETEKFGA